MCYSYLSCLNLLVILGDPHPQWHIREPWCSTSVLTSLYKRQPSIRATTIRVHGIIKTPGSRRTLDPREVGERQTCKPPHYTSIDPKWHKPICVLSCVINVEKGATENGVTLWSIFSRNGTQQWHPSMAPSNGTQQYPAMAPKQWHRAMAPNVNPAKVGSQPPLLLEVRTPIAKAIWGNINNNWVGKTQICQSMYIVSWHISETGRSQAMDGVYIYNYRKNMKKLLQVKQQN